MHSIKTTFRISAFFILTLMLSCDNEPYEGGFLGNQENNCLVATQSTAEATLNFLGANIDNYVQVCTAYRAALQAQIQACGDPDGSLLAIVNQLGDCSEATQDPCELATTAADAAETAFEEASADNFMPLCNAYKAALENVINECGDEGGTIQVTIDGLDCSNNQANTSIVGTWRITSLTSNGIEELQDELDNSGICFWHEVYTESTLVEIDFSGDNCDIEDVGAPIDYSIDLDIISFANGDDSVEILQLTETTLIYQDVYSEMGEDFTDIYTFEKQ